MPRTKAASFDAQRAAIRDAAARLFAEKGYPSASIADLARACGISKALMYHYYRDKEDLLADVATSYVDRLASIVDDVAAQQLPPAAHLRRLVDAFMAEYEHSAERHRVLVQDVKYLERAHRARVLARERKVVDSFAAVIADLAPDAAARGLRKPLAMILFGMINWTFTWLKDRGPLTYSDMAPLVTDLFLGGIGRIQPAASAPRARRRRPEGATPLKAIA